MRVSVWDAMNGTVCKPGYLKNASAVVGRATLDRRAVDVLSKSESKHIEKRTLS